MKKRLLVTGGSGFIGQACLKLLEDADVEVFVLSSKQPVKHNWIQFDLLKDQGVDQLIKTVLPTHLLHLAWNVNPGHFWNNFENLDWLTSSLNLFKAFYQEGGKRIVVAGSCAEIHPNTLYGSSKLALHHLLHAFATQFDASYAWGRIFYLYGPNESPGRFIPQIINSLVENRSIQCSDGTQCKDYLHVHDAARALVALIESPLDGIFDIGSGQGFSLKEIASKIVGILGNDFLIQWGKRPSSDTSERFIANIERLKNEVKWAPTISLDEGLYQTIQWWQKKRCPL